MSSPSSNPAPHHHRPDVYNAPGHSAAAPHHAPHPQPPTQTEDADTTSPTDSAYSIKDHIDHLKADFTSRLNRSKQLLKELQAYGGHYLSAQLDAVALKARTLAIYAALGLVAGLVAIAGLIYATILLLSGLADAIGVLLGHRPWLGAMITGFVVLAGAAITTYLLVSSLLGKSRRQLHQKYEDLKSRQRNDLGRDVTAAAKSPATTA
jgi:hypothetical protein